MKLVLSALGTLTLLLAAAPAQTVERWSGTANIGFSGTSTLHDWEGKVAPRPFIATVTRDPSGRPARVKGTVTVQVSKMDTAEPKRDENMRKAMKAADFPLVKAVIDASAEEIAGSGSTPAKLPIQLTLLGKEQEQLGTISNWKLNGNEASFDLDVDLSLKASGITVPSVAFFIKVGDRIKIHARVKLLLS
jgi:polyisoprenoid-binding protein YceI